MLQARWDDLFEFGKHGSLGDWKVGNRGRSLVRAMVRRH